MKMDLQHIEKEKNKSIILKIRACHRWRNRIVCQKIVWPRIEKFGISYIDNTPIADPKIVQERGYI